MVIVDVGYKKCGISRCTAIRKLINSASMLRKEIAQNQRTHEIVASTSEVVEPGGIEIVGDADVAGGVGNVGVAPPD